MRFALFVSFLVISMLLASGCGTDGSVVISPSGLTAPGGAEVIKFIRSWQVSHAETLMKEYEDAARRFIHYNDWHLGFGHLQCELERRHIKLCQAQTRLAEFLKGMKPEDAAMLTKKYDVLSAEAQEFWQLTQSRVWEDTHIR